MSRLPGPGPNPSRDLSPQWDIGPRMPRACQLCCNGGGSPYPKKNPDSRLPKARAFHGPTGDGLSPQSDLLSGLVQLAAIALPSVQNWPPWGLGPLPEAAPLHPPPLSVLFWQNLGALCGQQKPLMSRLAAVRIKCSEGLGAQGRRKCVVLVCSKGTIACS